MGLPLPKTILVIDDDPAVTDIITYFLAEKGFNTVSAQSGLEALRCIDNQNFDLIIMDFYLKLEVFRENVAKIRLKTNAPLISITGDPGGMSATDRNGINAVLEKPFNSSELLTIIESQLRVPGH